MVVKGKKGKGVWNSYWSLALPQLLPHHRPSPDTTLYLQPGHVVRQGGMAWQGMHIQAYSVVKASYYCAETSYPRTGTNVNDMLCRKRAEATS